MKLHYISFSMLKHCMVLSSSRISDAIVSLQENELKICFVIDQDERLVGTITDGDVRRGLLNGFKLDATVDLIMWQKPWWIIEGETPTSEFLTLMMEQKISAFPVLGSSHKVVGAFALEHYTVNSTLENELLIMAGGFGKRMKPITDTLPKPMIEINGKPMLEHIILKAKAEGFVNIIISVFHLSETIENHFGSGERFGVSIKYLREDKPLGTGGALNLMNPRPKKPFLVTNGDLITSFSFRELLTFHEKSLSLATMAIKEHKIKNPFGVVSMQSDKIVGFEEKPTYVSNINAGVYALNPELIDYLKPSEVVDMPTLLKRCIDAGISVMAFPIHEKWIDVGRPRDLYELDQSYKHLSL